MGNFSFLSKRNYEPSEPQSSRRLFSYNKNGTLVNEDSAMTASAFNRGVIYLSSQIAKLPWKVKDLNKKILEDDRVTKILDLTPNPEMSAMCFRLYMTQTALIQGNCYAEIERDGIGRPVNLWPILPGYCEPIRNKGKLFYRIPGAGSASGKDTILDPRDIFHVKNLHMADGIVGKGIVQYAREVLGITLGADIFANSLYSNGAIPSGILTVPGGLSDEAFARVKESWDNSHGKRKVGGTAIFEEGMKYDPLSFAPDVLQFIDSRKFNVYDIARFLGVPPQKLYDSESQTFKNVEHTNIQVANDTIDPWTKMYEQEADIKLLGKRFGGKNSQFDLYDLFRGDMDTRSTYFKNMFGIGVLSPNEIRTKEGEGSYDGGDRHFIATNNFTPIDRLNEVIDSQINGKPSQIDQTIANYLKSR